MKVVGGAMRLGYYAARGRLGGAASQGHREMTPHLAATTRALLRLALGRG